MSLTTVGRVLMSIGVMLIMGGLIGVFVGGDDPATGDVATPTTSTTTTTSGTTRSPTPPVPTSTTLPIPTPMPTTTPVPTEDPETFLEILSTALETVDSATLMARLNQATIDRYGADQCLKYLESIDPAEQNITIRDVGVPGPWNYLTDEVSTSIDDVTAIEVNRLVNSQTLIQELHWKLVDGQYTWFTDCGQPT